MWEFSIRPTTPVQQKSDDNAEHSPVREGRSVSRDDIAKRHPDFASSRMTQPLRALQQAYEVVVADADLSVDDALAAQQITAAMQTVLAGRLKRKLAGKDL